MSLVLAVAAVTGLPAAPPPAAAIDNGLARTPPMGFNNWNATRCRAEFNEAMIKGIADIFVERGLKAAGYQYVNLDDCWAQRQRDAQGNLVPDFNRFPSSLPHIPSLLERALVRGCAVLEH